MFGDPFGNPTLRAGNRNGWKKGQESSACIDQTSHGKHVHMGVLQKSADPNVDGNML